MQIFIFQHLSYDERTDFELCRSNKNVEGASMIIEIMHCNILEC